MNCAIKLWVCSIVLLVERFRLSAFASRDYCEELGEANCSLCISSVSVVKMTVSISLKIDLREQKQIFSYQYVYYVVIWGRNESSA